MDHPSLVKRKEIMSILNSNNLLLYRIKYFYLTLTFYMQPWFQIFIFTTNNFIYAPLYSVNYFFVHGTFYKFLDFFVQAFKIVVDS